MTYRPYAGIGSRETPPDVMALLTQIASTLENLGFTLRSGHASGADEAFEDGVANEALKEIFLPWKGFNGSTSPCYGWATSTHEKLARAIAQAAHPNWGRCSEAAQKLHMRNVKQVLGDRLDRKSLFVICWTPGGKGGGGTGQALRIAGTYEIPIFDLGLPNRDEILNQLSDRVREFTAA